MSDLRTPLSRVKGLGSAKDGTHHFWHQRLTALLQIPLVLWLAFSLASMPVEHATLVSWVAQPLVTVVLSILIASVFYHAKMGLQVIIEDYISNHAQRLMALLLSNTLCLLFGAAGVISVLRIAFGA